MTDFRIEGDSLTFWLRVKPKSRQDQMSITASGELCLEVRALPSEGRANDALIRYLARSLGLPQASIAILSGHHSRHKLLRITGPSAGDTLKKLQAMAGERTVNS